jgi:hypothetical protein
MPNRPIDRYLRMAEPLIPLLFIWGLQGLCNAAYDIFIRWLPVVPIKTYTTAAASLVSLLFVVKAAASASRSGQLTASALGRLLWMTLPFWVVVGGAVLLQHVQAVDLFYTDLFRALLLSFFYVLLGLFVSRHLVWLGLWLFALCALLSLRYLGFVPVILDMYGGLSLIACGVILRRQMAL